MENLELGKWVEQIARGELEFLALVAMKSIRKLSHTVRISTEDWNEYIEEAGVSIILEAITEALALSAARQAEKEQQTLGEKEAVEQR